MAIPGDQTQTGADALWSNMVNVEVSDDVYATVNTTSSDPRSNILHDFNIIDFSAPPTSILLGIEVNIEWKVENGTAQAFFIRLEQSAQAIAGSDNKTSTVPTVETTDTFGSPTDLWNTGFTHIGDLGASNAFGMAISVDWLTGAPNTISIDFIELIIYSRPTKSGAKLVRSYYRSPKGRRSGAHPAGF